MSKFLAVLVSAPTIPFRLFLERSLGFLTAEYFEAYKKDRVKKHVLMSIPRLILNVVAVALMLLPNVVAAALFITGIVELETFLAASAALLIYTAAGLALHDRAFNNSLVRTTIGEFLRQLFSSITDIAVVPFFLLTYAMWILRVKSHRKLVTALRADPTHSWKKLYFASTLLGAADVVLIPIELLLRVTIYRYAYIKSAKVAYRRKDNADLVEAVTAEMRFKGDVMGSFLLIPLDAVLLALFVPIFITRYRLRGMDALGTALRKNKSGFTTTVLRQVLAFYLTDIPFFALLLLDIAFIWRIPKLVSDLRMLIIKRDKDRHLRKFLVLHAIYSVLDIPAAAAYIVLKLTPWYGTDELDGDIDVYRFQYKDVRRKSIPDVSESSYHGIVFSHFLLYITNHLLLTSSLLLLANPVRFVIHHLTVHKELKQSSDSQEDVHLLERRAHARNMLKSLLLLLYDYLSIVGLAVIHALFFTRIWFSDNYWRLTWGVVSGRISHREGNEKQAGVPGWCYRRFAIYHRIIAYEVIKSIRDLGIFIIYSLLNVTLVRTYISRRKLAEEKKNRPEEYAARWRTLVLREFGNLLLDLLLTPFILISIVFVTRIPFLFVIQKYGQDNNQIRLNYFLNGTVLVVLDTLSLLSIVVTIPFAVEFKYTIGQIKEEYHHYKQSTFPKDEAFRDLSFDIESAIIVSGLLSLLRFVLFAMHIVNTVLHFWHYLPAKRKVKEKMDEFERSERGIHEFMWSIREKVKAASAYHQDYTYNLTLELDKLNMDKLYERWKYAQEKLRASAKARKGSDSKEEPAEHTITPINSELLIDLDRIPDPPRAEPGDARLKKRKMEPEEIRFIKEIDTFIEEYIHKYPGISERLKYFSSDLFRRIQALGGQDAKGILAELLGPLFDTSSPLDATYHTDWVPIESITPEELFRILGTKLKTCREQVNDLLEKIGYTPGDMIPTRFSYSLITPQGEMRPRFIKIFRQVYRMTLNASGGRTIGPVAKTFFVAFSGEKDFWVLLDRLKVGGKYRFRNFGGDRRIKEADFVEFFKYLSFVRSGVVEKVLKSFGYNEYGMSEYNQSIRLVGSDGKFSRDLRVSMETSVSIYYSKHWSRERSTEEIIIRMLKPFFPTVSARDTGILLDLARGAVGSDRPLDYWNHRALYSLLEMLSSFSPGLVVSVLKTKDPNLNLELERIPGFGDDVHIFESGTSPRTGSVGDSEINFLVDILHSRYKLSASRNYIKEKYAYFLGWLVDFGCGKTKDYLRGVSTPEKYEYTLRHLGYRLSNGKFLEIPIDEKREWTQSYLVLARALMDVKIWYRSRVRGMVPKEKHVQKILQLFGRAKSLYHPLSGTESAEFFDILFEEYDFVNSLRKDRVRQMIVDYMEKVYQYKLCKSKDVLERIRRKLYEFYLQQEEYKLALAYAKEKDELEECRRQIAEEEALMHLKKGLKLVADATQCDHRRVGILNYYHVVVSEFMSTLAFYVQVALIPVKLFGLILYVPSSILRKLLIGRNRGAVRALYAYNKWNLRYNFRWNRMSLFAVFSTLELVAFSVLLCGFLYSGVFILYAIFSTLLYPLWKGLWLRKTLPFRSGIFEYLILWVYGTSWLFAIGLIGLVAFSYRLVLTALGDMETLPVVLLLLLYTLILLVSVYVFLEFRKRYLRVFDFSNSFNASMIISSHYLLTFLHGRTLPERMYLSALLAPNRFLFKRFRGSLLGTTVSGGLITLLYIFWFAIPGYGIHLLNGEYLSNLYIDILAMAIGLSMAAAGYFLIREVWRDKEISFDRPDSMAAALEMYYRFVATKRKYMRIQYSLPHAERRLVVEIHKSRDALENRFDLDFCCLSDLIPLPNNFYEWADVVILGKVILAYGDGDNLRFIDPSRDPWLKRVSPVNWNYSQGMLAIDALLRRIDKVGEGGRFPYSIEYAKHSIKSRYG